MFNARFLTKTKVSFYLSFVQPRQKRQQKYLICLPPSASTIQTHSFGIMHKVCSLWHYHKELNDILSAKCIYSYLQENGSDVQKIKKKTIN